MIVDARDRNTGKNRRRGRGMVHAPASTAAASGRGDERPADGPLDRQAGERTGAATGEWAGDSAADSASNSASNSGRRSWLRRRFAGSPRRLWAANLLLVAAACGWAFFDPGMHSVLTGDVTLEGLAADWRNPRVLGLFTVACLAAGNLLWLASGLWLGSSQFRRLSSLVVLIGLVGVWLGVGLNSPLISWQGRRFGMLRYVAAIERLGQPVIEQWPKYDGQVPGLGPFMAYPVGQPTTLILLTPPDLHQGGPAISAVERTSDGAVRFELTDAGGNDWLEWHPRSEPASYLGGLVEHRVLVRATHLSGDWYLVRYRDPVGVAQTSADRLSARR